MVIIYETPLQEQIVEILETGPKSRNDICEQLGFAEKTQLIKTYKGKKYAYDTFKKRTSVYDSIARLMSLNVVVKDKDSKYRRHGRHATIFKLVDTHGSSSNN